MAHEDISKVSKQIKALERAIKDSKDDDMRISLAEIKCQLENVWHIKRYGCRNNEYWAKKHTALTVLYEEALKEKNQYKNAALGVFGQAFNKAKG